MPPDLRIGFIGFGRFSRALTCLLEPAGFAVRAYDPFNAPPPTLAVSTLAALVTGSDAVVLAVPFGHLPEALRALKPHLKPPQLLIDVCSVKEGPVAMMTEHLGTAVPWVGTHPLFGPTTLSLNERPLRAVVCPNPLHEGAAPRARALYEALGCEVLEQTPEAHDRTMAESHLLACFVAEGMLGAEIARDVPFVTPSFRAIARVMTGVQAEADHLRAAVHQGNAYGGAARKRLLAALETVDRALTAPEVHRVGSGAVESLMEARERIDEVDRELISLLARRAELSRQVVALKDKSGQAVHDPDREDNMLRLRRAWAAALGLEAEAVEGIFKEIVRFSKAVQEAQRTQGAPR